MLKIGITGGIGSGKTTVTRVFKLLNIPVYYADDVAKHIMVNDKELVDAIKNKLGKNAYLVSGSLNRSYIADIVFNNPIKLQQLNNLIHPAVFTHYNNWHTQQNAPYTIKEAALLFETNFYTYNNYNILVTSPLKLRIKNLKQRDNSSEDKINAIINNQMPENQKQKLADFTIHNNEQSFIIKQVLQLHTHFLNYA
ncbi:MAG: dephospho-CoA kinase [Sphingobacteriales bacterium]|nr:MAG: dephospho-CoA kinase [Sphingobacteriales bacterium]TAF83793.1 MAG: dephospho-CoA kinase [Sphingobacteriales bacterium]